MADHVVADARFADGNTKLEQFEEWENTFRRWYPAFRPESEAKNAA